MLFDIIIPTYNNLEELQQCLSGLENQTIRGFRVWICVDGSTDGTLEYLNNAHYHFTFIVKTHTDNKNHGRAATRNLPLNELKYKYVVFLDSDLIPAQDLLEKHLQILEVGNTISLGCVQYDDVDNVWTNYILSRGKFRFNTVRKVPFQYFESNNVAMPSAILKAVQGFDENITTYGGEDTELANRIYNQYQLVTIYNRSAVTSGVLNKSLNDALQQREDFARKNLSYIINKNAHSDALFQIRFLQKKRAYVLFKISAPFENYIIRIVSKKTKANRGVHLLVFLSMYRGLHGL
ncbi:MAG: glycosyltransferase [Chitinophagaceae bacterium]